MKKNKILAHRLLLRSKIRPRKIKVETPIQVNAGEDEEMKANEVLKPTKKISVQVLFLLLSQKNLRLPVASKSMAQIAPMNQKIMAHTVVKAKTAQTMLNRQWRHCSQDYCHRVQRLVCAPTETKGRKDFKSWGRGLQRKKKTSSYLHRRR